VIEFNPPPGCPPTLIYDEEPWQFRVIGLNPSRELWLVQVWYNSRNIAYGRIKSMDAAHAFGNGVIAGWEAREGIDA
jgi:hypothetical protein